MLSPDMVAELRAAVSSDGLIIERSQALANPVQAAEELNRFLGAGLDVAKMAAAVGF